MMFVGVLALGTSLLVLFLPETAGRELPQTLQQGEDFSKGDHFWSFPCCNKIDVDRHRNGNNNCTIER